MTSSTPYLQRGATGRDVQLLQADIASLGVALPRSIKDAARPVYDADRYDGKLGSETLSAAHALMRGMLLRPDQDSDDYLRKIIDPHPGDSVPLWFVSLIAEASEIERTEAAEPVNTGLTSVDAWTGRASLSTRTGASRLRLAQELGLTGVRQIVNDNTGRMREGRWFQNEKWHLYFDEDRIVSTLAPYVDAGIRVRLMSWLVPQADYVDQAADALMRIGERLGHCGLEFDLEEPWTTDRYEPHAEVAARFWRAFSGYKGTLGINCIVYHHQRKIGDLFTDNPRCDYTLLQAYSTNRQTSAHLSPRRIGTTAHKLFRKRYGDAPTMEMGTAWYRLDGAGGMTAPKALRAQMETARNIGEVTETCGWYLESIRRSKGVQGEIRRWSDIVRGVER